MDICEVQTSACSGWETIETHHGEIKNAFCEREHAEANMWFRISMCRVHSLFLKNVHSLGYLQLPHAVCRGGSKLCKQVTMHRPELVKVACQACRQRCVFV